MFTQNQDVFNTLLGAVSEGVIIVDEHRKIVESNESAQNMFGYDRKELIMQPLNILIPQSYHADHGAHFENFMKQKRRRQMGQGRDIYGARKDGSSFPVEAGLNPFTIYGKNYVMALVIDISIRKKQELRIKELNNELEKKVKERTKALEGAIVELKTLNVELDHENKKRIAAQAETKKALKKERELNELKTKFLSLVSHEFKTPLSGILTSAMLLSKYKLAEQQAKRDKHIATITSKVHYLNNILNDFLSVEKLETGKLNYDFKDFKLSKLVNEVIYNCNMLLKEGQKIIYPEDIDEISMCQDLKVLELSLSNIVHNAIKYSSENTIIKIDISQNKKETTFKVTDQGMGIPEKDQKNIFNRYFRAENAILTQGTGIGLNIVKTHLKNLGGSITFMSEENIGTTFYIRIPNKGKK